MRKIIGAVCVLLGVVCLIGSAGFAVYNRFESRNAEKTADSLLGDVQSKIYEQKTEEETASGQMATVDAGGYECIGVLSIPDLGLELPVLKDWSYSKLKKAPCLYYGSYYEKDFVIAAHNYKTHFGTLSRLKAGDIVMFTDALGKERYYEVVLLETLPQNATREMITAGFDLSLYTCTLSGTARVTVRCNLIK